ncbi:glucokinase [Pantoea sp. Mhis]|uniref:glucokinase n=1 Tax=Pantoea sp. Mhis TaxID=2576759 RepID=UPI001357E661|nr:glucokinase [Pantoea sp. Mhis]MXP56079.1 glucokinase [Pantoea sp. Mhis]
MTRYALVGDVGGTNTRLALCEINSGIISQVKTFLTAEYANLELVIKEYLNKQQLNIINSCIAIACPIKHDWIEMTNRKWAFSIQQMKENLGLSHLEIINDFTAISMAIPMLTKNDIIQFGGKLPIKNKPIAIYGAGTGLGVSYLVQIDKRWVSFAGEGGHVDFAPNSQEESDILNILRNEMGHVSAERVLSGAGLVNLYRAIVKSNHREPIFLRPKDVTERALESSCIDCRRALTLFCIIMGRFGGNLALNLGTFGGVYIAGGIVPRFLEFFKASGFRAAFEDKGRFRNYLIDIPVYMIMHDRPGLLGAGVYIRQMMGYML